MAQSRSQNALSSTTHCSFIEDLPCTFESPINDWVAGKGSSIFSKLQMLSCAPSKSARSLKMCLKTHWPPLMFRIIKRLTSQREVSNQYLFLRLGYSFRVCFPFSFFFYPGRIRWRYYLLGIQLGRLFVIFIVCTTHPKWHWRWVKEWGDTSWFFPIEIGLHCIICYPGHICSPQRNYNIHYNCIFLQFKNNIQFFFYYIHLAFIQKSFSCM